MASSDIHFMKITGYRVERVYWAEGGGDALRQGVEKSCKNPDKDGRKQHRLSRQI